MIRKIILFDILSLLPAFFLAGGQTLAWIGITFICGIVLVAFGFRHIGNTLRSVSHQRNFTLRSAGFFAPALGGFLFILPGLISDVLAAIILLMALPTGIKGLFSTSNGQKPKHTRKRNIIEPEYETLSEEQPKHNERN